MEQVMEHCGGFFLEVAVFCGLIALLFARATEGAGAGGVMATLAAELSTGGSIQTTHVTAYPDFSVYRAESGKEKPQITYAGDALTEGENDVAACFLASDFEGSPLAVCILSVSDEEGNELSQDVGRGTYEIPSGVLTVRVSATDAKGQTTVKRFFVPVNDGAGRESHETYHSDDDRSLYQHIDTFDRDDDHGEEQSENGIV